MHGHFKIETSGRWSQGGGKRVGLATVVPRSDGNSEFSEGPARRCIRMGPPDTRSHSMPPHDFLINPNGEVTSQQK
jgi:hypothetical protein